MSNTVILIILIVLAIITLLLPEILVKLRDAEMKKKKEQAREEQAKEKHLSLDEFKKRLFELYKEKFAISDGNSYILDPTEMNKLEAFYDNGVTIKALKDQYPEYAGEYDDDELCKKARLKYGEDLRNLMSD